ncbi:DUF488 domain-containing protein [Mycobacterium kansasii]|uniref:DUF488 domain-containing protein n=4 Tax=Mycobacterium kansasii TaxID=1768 RepID=A0A1V3XEA5_MYCKA|nr:DUF488 domain-containing protein [Mycobacterium kansasii]ETZ98237.1 hypothetical protein I547_6634 [Mycobacterium kansasii 824]AGZ53719.1 hypothetical protein MKAN_28000 [Mycobacterium kansasii ATCC 12478]ARG54698.1 hypothetical protein B1T43_01175 [Mycobacterium kansasii]ARG60150.1 hypothetical protein B1T45_01180 [Mycobacterium kansasii]ARG67888.1 hypothetical protein B1T47_01275 [Mycobacterium kansasii]
MLYTIGHGAKTAGQLTDMLRRHDINLLVDVRSFPGSRRNPDVSKQAMPDWLGAAGIAYRHEPDLGGRRKPPVDPVQRDRWWENQAFANYAAHTRTPGFHAAYQRLLRDADTTNVAVMCGEPTWWRCHRRMIADLAVRDGHRVQHIMPNGALSQHRPSDWLTHDVVDGS